jgi:hypothetical protein
MGAVGGGGGEEDERAVRGIERREDEGGGAGAVMTFEGGLGIPRGGEVRESGDGEPEESERVVGRRAEGGDETG